MSLICVHNTGDLPKNWQTLIKQGEINVTQERDVLSEIFPAHADLLAKHKGQLDIKLPAANRFLGLKDSRDLMIKQRGARIRELLQKNINSCEIATQIFRNLIQRICLILPSSRISS